MKRIQPAPMGRAYPIRKRTCHVTIELGSLGKAVPTAARKSAKAATSENRPSKAGKK